MTFSITWPSHISFVPHGRQGNLDDDYPVGFHSPQPLHTFYHEKEKGKIFPILRFQPL
jgi:hypothetical protein